MIKLKPFDLEAALNGEPVMLRDGSKAYVRHHETETSIRGNFNLVGIKEDYPSYLTWTPEGNYDTCRNEYDIISMYPKTHVINGFEVPVPDATILVETLESIAEYWNQDSNEGAMRDACEYAQSAALAALTAYRKGGES